uniref:Uroplakin 3B n=1 Tax=Capra hircus TaxID=9925 RepID=A0A8C2SBJ2_CAPHI
MSNPWGQQIQPLNPSDQLSGRRGRLGGAAGDARSGAPSQPRERSLWGSGCCGQTLGQTNGWTLVLPMGLGRGQSPLLMALLLLLACLQTGMSLERISYVPQLSSATLAGRLTQSTFTLEQPRGQFSHPSISDSDAIWLVVAHSNATQKFTAPQKVEDTPVPADFPQGGYYLTLRASRALYPGGPPSNQLRVLRVGNDTHCSPRTRGCNRPLPGPGPYRVKFLVMSDRGPMAETEWSSETRLQQADRHRLQSWPQGQPCTSRVSTCTGTTRRPSWDRGADTVAGSRGGGVTKTTPAHSAPQPSGTQTWETDSGTTALGHEATPSGAQGL